MKPENVAQLVFFIRGEKVLLDADLAMLYGVEPRVLNQAVARNRKRFPADFMFQLSAREDDALTSQIVISDKDDARGASALRSQICHAVAGAKAETSNIKHGRVCGLNSSFSTMEISRSMAEAMVGGVEGVPDVPPAGELLVACAKAEAAARDNTAVSSKEVWSCFIGLLLFWLEHERTCSRD